MTPYDRLESLARAYLHVLSEQNGSFEACKVVQDTIKKAREHYDGMTSALQWCETVYGNDWPEKAAIRDTINQTKGE